MNTVYDKHTKVAIIGAGPAGVSTALFLAKEGIPHLLIDKAGFPRDKICGDGLSGKVVGLLKELDPTILEQMRSNISNFLPSWGVSFIAPNGKGIDLPFSKDMSAMAHAPGFVSRRMDFDHFLLKQLDSANTDLSLETELSDLKSTPDGIVLHLKSDGKVQTCLADLVIGAEGTGSLVAKKLAQLQVKPQHLFAGLRVYYENISGMHPQNFIELHFIKEALPGYFWVFPLPGNRANVGIGILSKDVKEKKLNLKDILRRAIETNPQLKKRFANAVPVSDVKGWRLPLGSVKRPLSGERFLLTGDAAALIDPFTGEGIGNAILSGKLAARICAEQLKISDFSETALSRYDQLLYDELWSELQISYKIQQLVRFPWLFNFVINRLYKNPRMQETFSSMFNDVDMRARLRSPAFYFRMLFNLKNS